MRYRHPFQTFEAVFNAYMPRCKHLFFESELFPILTLKSE